MLLADPELAEWLWPGPLGGPRTAEQTAELLREDAAAWERDGFGPWVLLDRATGEITGRAGLKRTSLEGRSVVELGWLIDRRRWGLGLATEAAREALRMALEDLALDEVVAFTVAGNLASRRVMEKLGLTYDRDVMHAGLRHVLYRARRDGPRR